MITILESKSAPRILAPLSLWFDKNKRSLPWRSENLKVEHADPYIVLVSEFMLQQTQINTVIPYFERWMKRFPTLKKLASVSPEIAMKHWEGLGYYRRCRNLQKSCQQIQQHGWPRNRDEMKLLPGIGSYTSAAIGSIAFQWPTPAIDGNVIRLLSRLHAKNFENQKELMIVEAWLEPALRKHGPSRLTQALMDFGSLICKKNNPFCMQCPLKKHCKAYNSDQISSFPKTKSKPSPKETHQGLLIIFNQDLILIQKPKIGGLLDSVYTFPSVRLSGKERIGISYLHRYTHIKEYTYPLAIHVKNKSIRSPYLWVNRKELSRLPLGNRDKLMLKRIKSLKPIKKLPKNIQILINKDIFKDCYQFPTD